MFPINLIVINGILEFINFHDYVILTSSFLKVPMSESSLALNLFEHGLHRIWHDAGLARAIAAMEETEDWVLDGTKAAEDVVAVLCSKLPESSSDAIGNTVAVAPGDIVNLMGYMKSGRALALFRWLAEVSPESTSRILEACNDADEDFSRLLIERVSTLERLRLLSRVFSPARLAQVLEVLEDLLVKDLKK